MVKLKKSIVDRIAELNASGDLQAELRLGAVAVSLANLEDEESALQLLADLEESAAKVSDPTAWVRDAAEAVLAEWQADAVEVEEEEEAEAAAPAPAGGKPGDWTCPDCGDLQFARNEYCRLCETPRPKGSAKAKAKAKAKAAMAACSRCMSVAAAALAVACGLALWQWPKRIGCGDGLSWCLDGAISLLPEDGTDYCELSGGGELNMADIQKKGYTVVRNWLPEDMRTQLLAIQKGLGDARFVDPGKNGGSTPGYRLPAMFGIDIFKEVLGLGELLDGAVRAVESETDIRISIDDTYDKPAVFFHTNASDSTSMMFGWHQDVENYFLFNNLYDYLDFYIMLDKPDPNAAGVMVVPFDRLESRARGLYDVARKAKDRTVGAASFIDLGDNRTLFAESYDDSQLILNFNMDDVACSPTLHAGDLLLFRGDTIHRTQPHQTHRTSLNINVHMPYWKYLRISDTLSGGQWKFSWMAMAPHQYAGLHGNPPGFTYAIYAGYMYRAGLARLRHGLGLLGL